MKRQIKTIMCAASSLLALAALADEMPAAPADPVNPEYQRMFEARMNLLKEIAKVTDVLGMPVENDQDERLGKVQTLYVNLQSGRIVQVIVSGGGTLTAVPPGALHADAGDKFLHLNATRERFASAPRFDPADPGAVTESNRVAAVYAFYNLQPYFVTDSDGIRTTNSAGAMDPLNGKDSNTLATEDPDGRQNRNYYSADHQAIGSFSDLGNVRNVRDLLGMPVRNRQQVSLGHVDNFIVDLSAGRVAATFIVTGRFLWTGGERSAVPSTALWYDAERKDLQLDATPEMLEMSPDFEVSNWPNFVLPGYLAGTYYPYKIQPYDNVAAPGKMAGSAGGKNSDASPSVK